MPRQRKAQNGAQRIGSGRVANTTTTPQLQTVYRIPAWGKYWECEKLAYEVAKRYDCELLIITASVSLSYRKNERQTLSPLEFIQVIRDAKFVIATSFHGTAFSLIFEKQFYTLGLGANSDRVLTLFDNLGLKERYIEDFSKVNFHDIDYSDVKNKLSNMIYNSKKLLNEALDIWYLNK